MKKSKIFLLLFIIVTGILLIGCNKITFRLGRNESAKKYDIAVEMSEEIMRCFNEEDTEGLKSMFFANDLPTNNLDKQIKEAFEFYKGPSVSYEFNMVASGEDVSNGETTKLDIEASNNDIKTESDEIYKIIFHSYIIYNSEETKK